MRYLSLGMKNLNLHACGPEASLILYTFSLSWTNLVYIAPKERQSVITVRVWVKDGPFINFTTNLIKPKWSSKSVSPFLVIYKKSIAG